MSYGFASLLFLSISEIRVSKSVVSVEEDSDARYEAERVEKSES